MMKKRMIWMFVFLISLELVLAIGLRPAKTTIFFESSLSYDGEFWVINNGEREFDMNIYVEESPLSSFLILEKKTINFKSNDEAFPVKFNLKLPEEIPIGRSTINVILEEILEDKNPNVISSKIVLKHKINVQGPYPDKFAIVKLNFQEKRDFFELISEVENKGKEDIDKVQAKFFVNDKEQKKHIIETNSIFLKSKENQLLRAKLNKSLLVSGEYEVKSVTSYDDQKVEIIKTLRFGEPEIDIIYFDNFFIANKINKYVMELLNKWNKKIENVYVDVAVKKDDQEIDNFRTKSIDIEGLMIKKTSDYFDAKDKNPGTYVFEMIVHFWNIYKMDSIKFNVELLNEDSQDLKEANQVKILDEELNKENFSKKNSFSKLWLILFTFLLLIILVYIFYRYKNKNEYYGDEEELF